MIGTIVKYQNELKVRIAEPLCGILYLDPDKESQGLLNASQICAQVDGYVTKFNDTTPAGVKVNRWLFHIESFED